MISVHLARGKNGAFVSCKADGHAEYAAAGQDIVCSAVTILLRTVMQVLSGMSGIELAAEAPERGCLKFSVQVKEADLETDVRLICAGDFIEEGIGSLSGEYPKCVELWKETVK
jgi:uncharacterized protein